MTPVSSRPICARRRVRQSRTWPDTPPGLPPRLNRRDRAAGGRNMDTIEPHWISLLWFAGFATVCTVSFLVVAGMFPLHSRPDSVKSGAATLLVAGNALLLAALSIGTGFFGYCELRWSTLI